MSLVEDWFGDAFSTLHPLIQALHHAGGRLQGPVEVRYGRGLAGVIGRFLGWRLGIPPPSPTSRLCVHIHSDEAGLHWHRRFNDGREFRSLFVPVGHYPSGHWLERSGPVALGLKVDIREGGWHWRPVDMRVLGVPVPRWLMPRTEAYKEIVGGRYRFSVRISLPGVGMVLAYSGELMPAAAGARGTGPDG